MLQTMGQVKIILNFIGKHIFIDATRQHLGFAAALQQHTLHNVRFNLSFQDFHGFIRLF